MMKLTNASSKLIIRLQKRYIAEPTQDPHDLRRLAAEMNILPLFMDMGGMYGINVSGEIISFSWDNLESPRVETDPRICNIVLFQGSKRYPELAAIIPVRPNDACICPHCQGTGIEPFSVEHNIDNLVCYCGGLGWIPKTDAERGASITSTEHVWDQ